MVFQYILTNQIDTKDSQIYAGLTQYLINIERAHILHECFEALLLGCGWGSRKAVSLWGGQVRRSCRAGAKMLDE